MKVRCPLGDKVTFATQQSRGIASIVRDNMNRQHEHRLGKQGDRQGHAIRYRSLFSPSTWLMQDDVVIAIQAHLRPIAA